MSVRIQPVCNHKGGIGKNSACLNLLCSYVDRELKMLAVTLDAQAHSVRSPWLRDLLCSAMDHVVLDKVQASNYIVRKSDDLDFLAAGFRSQERESLSAKVRCQALVLKAAIQPLQSSHGLIFTGCPSTFGQLNFNVLYTASEIIRLEPRDSAVLKGLSQLFRTFKCAEKILQIKRRLCLNSYRHTSRRRLPTKVRDKLLKYYTRALLVTVVRKNALLESPGFGQSIFGCSQRSNGVKDYAALADDILYSRAID